MTAKEETADLIFNGEWRREPGALGKEWRWHLFQQPLPEQWLTYQIQIPGLNEGKWVVLKIRIHPAREVADITQALLNEISNQERQMPGTMILGKHHLREREGTDHTLNTAKNLSEQGCNEGEAQDYVLRLSLQPDAKDPVETAPLDEKIDQLQGDESTKSNTDTKEGGNEGGQELS